MSTDWKRNSVLIVTLITTILVLQHLPIGSGLKSSTGEIISESDFVNLVKVQNSTLKRDVLYDDNKARADMNIFTRLQRKKRNYVEQRSFTLEVLVAVDNSMTEFHKDGLRLYINNVFAFVSNIFSEGLINKTINFKVIDVHVVQKGVIGEVRDDKQYLHLFCNYISDRFNHYDTAMFITRNNICKDNSCAFAGRAKVTSICKPFSCALIQDRGLKVVYTIAHELGHIFSMAHDNELPCTKNYDPIYKHIIYSSLTESILPRYWSNCSRQSVLQYLRKIDISCLVNNQDTQTTNITLPGEIYSLDEQCHLRHGNFWKHSARNDENECKGLRCTFTQNNTHHTDNTHPWAEGTPCRNNTFWCRKGECVPRERPLGPAVHGGWGPWSDFRPCSLSCGGGVQVAERECNNPWPRNGGRDCKGTRKLYQSCNTQNCPPGSVHIRQQQCTNIIGPKDISHGSAAIWVPYYDVDSSEKCKLLCHWDDSNIIVGATRGGASLNVTDGTACSLDSFDKCVSGECRPAGCDNVLDSTAKLDKCGVCKGKNDTCEEYTDNFHLSDLYKMYEINKFEYSVTIIRKGAYNIRVTQRANFEEYSFGLRDDEGNYLLNPGEIQQTTVIAYEGVILTYNRSSTNIPDVNSAKWRKLKRDLVLEITSYRHLPRKLGNDTLLLTYTYLMDKPEFIQPEVESYRWELQDKWTECNALCDGKQYQYAVCVKNANGSKVESRFCDVERKPLATYQPCNTECQLSVEEAGVSECSASLVGKQEIKYRCIQTFPATDLSEIVDLKFCLSKPKLNASIESNKYKWCFG